MGNMVEKTRVFLLIRMH